MPTIKFSKSVIRELPAPDPSGKPTLYWPEDRDATPGLGILVSGVSASKSWVFQRNLANGKSRRITLGPVAGLTPEQAWQLAAPILTAILHGHDPKQTVAQRQMASMTVAEVLEHYLVASSNLAPATVRIYRFAARHLGPPLLNRALREITADDVERRFRAIAAEVAARRANGDITGGVNVSGKATANTALRLLGALWEFQAERDRGLGPNPLRGRRFRRQWHDLDRRTRHIPADRLAAFYNAAKVLPSDIQRDLVIIGLFTGMRENEVAGLRWEEVDLPNKMLRLPASRMKAKKAFDLPMSDVVYNILVVRRSLGREGQFVFPGYRRGQHCKSYTYALRQIGEATGITVSPHDLRRTFLNVVEQSEISPLAHKMLVAHSTGGDVTSGYKQLSLKDFRSAVQKVASKFAELCGMEVPTAENIVRLA